jgi:hypothetical protein
MEVLACHARIFLSGWSKRETWKRVCWRKGALQMGVVVSGWEVAETLWYLHIACLRLKEVLFSLKSSCKLRVTHED